MPSQLLAPDAADPSANAPLVWHYTDGPGLLSIVSNHVLWATASSFLNDAEEVELGYRLIEDEVRARATAGDSLAALLMSKVEAADRDPRGPSPGLFFILSAARHWDLLAMWRCYGGRGESYAIGLEPSAQLPVFVHPASSVLPAPNDPESRRLLRQRSWTPVRYDAPGQRDLAAAVFDGLAAELDGLRRRARDGEAMTATGMAHGLAETLDDMEQALVLIKHAGFHDEREVRHSTVLIHPDGLDGWPGVIRYRSTAYGMAPHVWLTGSRPDGPEAMVTDVAAPLPIRSVAISPSPNGDAATESLRALLRSRGYDVPVLRSSIPFRG